MVRDWIIFCDGSAPDKFYGLKCERCGVRQELPAQMPVDVFLKWTEIFTKRHESCALVQKGGE